MQVCLATPPAAGAAANSPFTPSATLRRYWNRKINNSIPIPTFLLSKSSPLTPTSLASLISIASQNNLSSHFSTFCSSAHLFCFPDLSSSSSSEHSTDSNFQVYTDRNFSSYGNSRPGGADSFSNYSDNGNVVANSFRRYSRDSTGHSDRFSNYAPDTNVPEQTFATYGAAATGGSGEFKLYAHNVNVPNLKFTSYESDANGRSQSFTTYSDNGNAGDQSFASYGRNGNGVPTDFSGYGKESNVVGSTFKGYSEMGNGEKNTFTSYAFNTNNPTNSFSSYSDGGNSGINIFTGYRDQANVGGDSFESYAKNSNSEKVNFVNYGKSFNEGTDTFKGYGTKGSNNHLIGFKIYGVNNTFKDYAKNGVSFAKYTNQTASASAGAESGRTVNRWVEKGKFFRESMLKEGGVMRMPDIRDKMPERSFLPRAISSKLPISSSGLGELTRVFHASENSSMAGMMASTVSECEREPSRGETKRCVGSVEDMVDFVVQVLGSDVVVRSTEGVKGSTKDVMIGKVIGINGGRVTESVSCHQSLFPYLVYYCHSVPKVRVYEADILDVKTKEKINHGVAICHLDTSAWGAGHGAFLALGSTPGKIEVCHWIFENDMTWTTADH
ncbi:hypothetical protein Scep_021338 [Stephania cephalantha]|uniref:BURP domain-containing protein n=1 Tax=Stephania cephalantha TaxID=152367 RepID=A0AAP0F464_9MAGN